MVKLPTRADLGPLPRVGASGGLARIRASLPSAPTVRPATPNIQLPSNRAIPDVSLPNLGPQIATVARLEEQGNRSVVEGIRGLQAGFEEVEAVFEAKKKEQDVTDAMRAEAMRDIAYLDLEREVLGSFKVESPDPDFDLFEGG